MTKQTIFNVVALLAIVVLSLTSISQYRMLLVLNDFQNKSTSSQININDSQITLFTDIQNRVKSLEDNQKILVDSVYRLSN